ncbi:MAG: TIGR03564 family F420-dependent LLM class oxidoreductase [Deltaproteobacteria bacterium]|nr:TIGR03564 family F420-dependent LLM class oxidoreductase [Deltaproteobacteria bacterium]
MRIGVNCGADPGGDSGIDGLIARAKEMEARGFHTMWLANGLGLDAINTQTVIGSATERIELGTAVVPSFPRHPMAMAQQALTAQAVCGGRFTLGIGLSHRPIIENMLGLSYDKPARHMREYVSVLAPLLRGEPVHFEGEDYRVGGALNVPGAAPVPLLIAALGDLMLGVAGSAADGTVVGLTGPKTIESHIVPRLRAAADAAGRPSPRVVASFPTALTHDPGAARDRVDQQMGMYAMLPSYRAMLDREGVAGPGDIAVVGDEETLDAALGRLRDIGVTDYDATLVSVDEGSDARTLDFLQSRL